MNTTDRTFKADFELRLRIEKEEIANGPSLSDSRIVSMYRVYDQYGRFIGWVFRAVHSSGTKAEWYAVTSEGNCSVRLLAHREAALETLAIMYHAEVLGSRNLAKLPPKPVVDAALLAKVA